MQSIMHAQHEPQVLPDFTMKLRHLHFSVIFLLHPDDAGRFLYFLATGQTTGSHGPLFRMDISAPEPGALRASPLAASRAGAPSGRSAYNGHLNLLGNWRIGIALGHKEKFVHTRPV